MAGGEGGGFVGDGMVEGGGGVVDRLWAVNWTRGGGLRVGQMAPCQFRLSGRGGMAGGPWVQGELTDEGRRWAWL